MIAFDANKPDLPDVVDAFVVFIGVAPIMYWPRSS